MSREGGRNGTADEAARMTDHEGHLVGRGIFSCDDEIAFVLTGDRVEDNDEFALPFMRDLSITFHFEVDSMAGPKRKGSVILKASIVLSMPSNCCLSLPFDPQRRPPFADNPLESSGAISTSQHQNHLLTSR